jgi:hypothetical protein
MLAEAISVSNTSSGQAVCGAGSFHLLTLPIKKRSDIPHFGEAKTREVGRSSFRFLECKTVQSGAESGKLNGATALTRVP